EVVGGRIECNILIEESYKLKKSINVIVTEKPRNARREEEEEEKEEEEEEEEMEEEQPYGGGRDVSARGKRVQSRYLPL
ncbi:uncharacterized protein ARB_00733, partial [Trichophyton benhamiae CBS 112371]